MTGRLFSILILFIFFFSSCQSQSQNQTILEQRLDTVSTQSAGDSGPNFNYRIEVPKEWEIRDTIMDGIKIRLLLSPQSLTADRPVGNIIISAMKGQGIAEFTTRNMEYLKLNMPGTIILKRGKYESTTYKGEWFTYTKVQNGITRDMINYIIPVNGYAYMITCGSNKGSIEKYRAIFDEIAKSFKV
jgi:hypothetical protein